MEGIIEALSHLEMGHQAIAALSSGQDPAKINLGGLEENLVIAFDPDVAGAGGIKKWIAVYPDARAIVPIDGDWNDFLRAQAPGKAAEVFDSLLSEMKCRADLLIAESAKDYADIHTMFYGYPPGLFTFERRYWWAALKAKVKKGDSSAVDVHCVSDFTCETEHYSLDNLPRTILFTDITSKLCRWQGSRVFARLRAPSWQTHGRSGRHFCLMP